MGLAQNIPRQLIRLGSAVALGFWAARTGDDLPREWAEALARFPEEADELHERARGERQRTRARAGAAGGEP